MEFLNLFALLVVFGIAIVHLQFYRLIKERHWLYGGIAFSAYSAALVFEIVLDFNLTGQALRLWYWFRLLMVMPAFGLGLLHLFYKDHALLKYVDGAFWVSALVGFVLLSFTSLTRAVDWYDPSQSIYVQFFDLFALNRPTRWLTSLVNIFGIAIPIWATFWALARRIYFKRVLYHAMLLLGVAAVFCQGEFIELGYLWTGWAVPVFGSLLIFVGLALLSGDHSLPGQRVQSEYGWRRYAKWHTAVIALVLIWGFQTRLVYFGDPALSVSNYDLGEFIRAAQRDLFAVEFFTSNRPASISFFYKLAEPATGYELTNLSSPAESIRVEKTLQPGLDRIVLGQMWLAIFSWSALAIAMARRIENPVLKVTGVVFILSFAYSPNLSEWDSILLSESVALSLFALMLAFTLELAPRILGQGREINRVTIGVLLSWALSMVLWVFSRDTNAYLLLIMLLTLCGILVIPRSRRAIHARLVFTVVIFLGGLFVFQNQTLARSDRWVNPFFNNMLINIFPHPERVAYFREQGMPITEEVLAFRDSLPNQDGFWEIPYLIEWVYAEGYSTYSRFLVSHPLFASQTVVNSFDVIFSENVQPFFNPGKDETPEWIYFLGNMLHPRSVGAMWVGILLTAIFLYQTWREPGKAVFSLAGLLAIFMLGLFAMLAVSVLGDSLGTIRHAMIAVVPFRLFVWVLPFFMVDRFLSFSGSRAGLKHG